MMKKHIYCTIITLLITHSYHAYGMSYTAPQAIVTLATVAACGTVYYINQKKIFPTYKQPQLQDSSKNNRDLEQFKAVCSEKSFQALSDGQQLPGQARYPGLFWSVVACDTEKPGQDPKETRCRFVNPSKEEIFLVDIGNIKQQDPFQCKICCKESSTCKVAHLFYLTSYNSSSITAIDIPQKMINTKNISFDPAKQTITIQNKVYFFGEYESTLFFAPEAVTALVMAGALPESFSIEKYCQKDMFSKVYECRKLTPEQLLRFKERYQ